MAIVAMGVLALAVAGRRLAWRPRLSALAGVALCFSSSSSGHGSRLSDAPGRGDALGKVLGPNVAIGIGLVVMAIAALPRVESWVATLPAPGRFRPTSRAHPPGTQ